MRWNYPGRSKLSVTKLLICSLISLVASGCSEDDDRTGLILAVLLATQSSSSPPCSTTGPCKMFIATNADITNGISGLDSTCANDSNKPSGGTYKALVVDGTNRIACTTANCSGGTSEHTGWVLKPNKEYRRKDGTTVIGTTNSNGVFTFPVTDGVDEPDGATFSITATGLESDWTSSSDDCTNWSTTAGNLAIGTFSDSDSNMIRTGGGAGTAGCTSNIQNLICVEQ